MSSLPKNPAKQIAAHPRITAEWSIKVMIGNRLIWCEFFFNAFTKYRFRRRWSRPSPPPINLTIISPRRRRVRSERPAQVYKSTWFISDWDNPYANTGTMNRISNDQFAGDAPEDWLSPMRIIGTARFLLASGISSIGMKVYASRRRFDSLLTTFWMAVAKHLSSRSWSRSPIISFVRAVQLENKYFKVFSFLISADWIVIFRSLIFQPGLSGRSYLFVWFENLSALLPSPRHLQQSCRSALLYVHRDDDLLNVFGQKAASRREPQYKAVTLFAVLSLWAQLYMPL